MSVWFIGTIYSSVPCPPVVLDCESLLPGSLCSAVTLGSSLFLARSLNQREIFLFLFIQDRNVYSQISPVSVLLITQVKVSGLNCTTTIHPLGLSFGNTPFSLSTLVIIHLFKCKQQDTTREVGNIPLSFSHKKSEVLLRIFTSV